MDEGFRRQGRLLPLGFYHILSASKNQLDLLAWWN